MENNKNKYISVSYQLFTVDADGNKQLVEKTEPGRPFTFISGFGFSLDAFEANIIPLATDAEFDFTLQPSEAFGDFDESGVHKLKRDVFSIDGRFDADHVFPDAVVTMTDEEGKRFMARVKSVNADGVVIDTNHPLAGETLQFVGKVLESREATFEEIQNLINQISGEGCCGCGGDCGGDCEGGCGSNKDKDHECHHGEGHQCKCHKHEE